MFLIYLLVGKILENIGLDLVNYVFKSISIFKQNVLTVGIFLNITRMLTDKLLLVK